jgi:hypothetical protein
MRQPPISEFTTLTPKYLRVPAACAYAGIGRAKLYQFLAEGQIKSVNVRQKGTCRGIRLINVESLDQFLESFAEA